MTEDSYEFTSNVCGHKWVQVGYRKPRACPKCGLLLMASHITRRLVQKP